MFKPPRIWTIPRGLHDLVQREGFSFSHWQQLLQDLSTLSPPTGIVFFFLFFSSPFWIYHIYIDMPFFFSSTYGDILIPNIKILDGVLTKYQCQNIPTGNASASPWLHTQNEWKIKSKKKKKNKHWKQNRLKGAMYMQPIYDYNLIVSSLVVLFFMLKFVLKFPSPRVACKVAVSLKRSIQLFSKWLIWWLINKIIKKIKTIVIDKCRFMGENKKKEINMQLMSSLNFPSLIM